MIENQTQLSPDEEYNVTTFSKGYVPLRERLAEKIAKREIDPTGRRPSDKGAKVDAGKPRMDLVLGAFSEALIEVSKVGTFGAKKYTENGWIEVPNGVQRYTDAMLRHYFYERNGEEVDSDSELLHASHLAWNALARLSLILKEKKRANTSGI